MHVSRTDLARRTIYVRPARVVAGDTLMDAAGCDAASVRVEPSVPAKARSRVAGSSQPSQPAVSANRVKLSYQIKAGDTLGSDRQRFKTTVTSIRSWNPDLSGDRLRRAPLTVLAPSDARHGGNDTSARSNSAIDDLPPHADSASASCEFAKL